MKFSDLLGDPEPESQPEVVPAPAAEAEPISVFAPESGRAPAAAPAPVPVVTPNPSASPVSRWADNVMDPATSRSGLAELNVRPPANAAPGAVVATAAGDSVSDQLLGLTEIVDDLLPSGRRNRR